MFKRLLVLLTGFVMILGISSSPKEDDLSTVSAVSAASVNGLLKVDPINPRYFTNASGKAIYLSGSHTWMNIQDRGETDPPPAFNYTAHLNWLTGLDHNFTRLWIWEQAYGLPRGQDWWFQPNFYKRTGPGNALDGKLKFDLNQFEQSTFDRLKARVTEAQNKGIYVSVMLFQGFSISKKGKVGNPWLGHPYNASNNINGINGDANGNGEGEEIHKKPTSTSIDQKQKAFINKVVDTLNDLDNVIWEISNEDVSSTANTNWQYDMINYIKSYEAGKPKQHLVGMTFQFPGGSNTALFNSPADWISPGGVAGEDYSGNPPAATGNKVILSDSDHFNPFGGAANDVWVWKSFTRGLQPILMDDPTGSLVPANSPHLVKARNAMGDTIGYANKVDLRSLKPLNSLSSTTYCLCKAGSEYIAFKPANDDSNFSVTPLATGTYTVEWFNVNTRATTAAANVTGTGANKSFNPPFSGPAVLYLKPVTTSLISNLVVNDTANAGDWSTQADLQVGDLQYGDRTYTLTSVPSSLAGEAWIRTANDSKTYTGATLATFKVTQAAAVYVGHYDAITPKPSWLSTWTDSGLNLVGTNAQPVQSLFKKTFAANATVTLGPNQGGPIGMYTVVVEEDAASLPAPFGYWKFDETSGTTAADSSGNGRNGTVAGATWTAAGKSNGALSFDGTNDSVNLPFVLNPSATNFTAAGWIKTDTTAKQIILQQLDGSGTGRAWLYLNNSFLKTHIGGSATASSNTLSTNTWYHIVVVKNGTNIKLYVNGVERASTTRTAESSTGAMKVGASKFSTEWFNGTIDQLRIYDSALSAADISALHNSGQ